MILWQIYGVLPLTVTCFNLHYIAINRFQCKRNAKTALHYSQQENEHEKDEIELSRKQLEIFLQRQEKKGTNDILAGQAQQQPRKQSIAARRVLMTERMLVESLNTSDIAISILRAFWLTESGEEAGEELMEAERLASMDSSSCWVSAEQKFHKIIKDHGTSWLEPIYRLASLLHKQDRLKESKTLYETVLYLKPWHFGALSDIVLVCNGMNDAVNANIWNSRQIPSLDDVDRRELWVDRVLHDIDYMLSEKDSTENITGLNPDVLDDTWQ